MPKRVISGLVLLVLMGATVPVAGDQFVVRCETGLFGRYKFCPVNTEDQVQLIREFSFRKCEIWRSWGFDRRGVWVDNGCRAEFRVGRSGGGAGAAVAGAIIGGAIVAAIMSGRENHSGEVVRAPGWAVGSFTGFSPNQDRDFNLDIDRDGQVTGDSAGEKISGHIANEHLHLGRADFILKKESWGFSAVPSDDSKEVIYFRRVEK